MSSASEITKEYTREDIAKLYDKLFDGADPVIGAVLVTIHPKEGVRYVSTENQLVSWSMLDQSSRAAKEKSEPELKALKTALETALKPKAEDS